MKILIADDEPVGRRLLEILLNKWGHEVSVAADGDEAWRILQDPSHPRIAILDWMMPGMDGVEVCRKIRQAETGPAMYVLLLTARQSTEDANGRYESVADDYLPKPYAPHELKARLRAAKRILSLEDEVQVAREAMKVETTHDPLTGLWNRSSILEVLHREIHRARRQCSPLAVLMVDIEHLGEINHRHGHLAGDAVLREVARRIRGSIRPYDSVGRFNGGQFVVVAPACDPPKALNQAQRVQSEICLESVETFEGAIPLTVRLGVAAGCDHHQAHEFISAADEALAEARKTGKPALVYDVHKLI